jgi:transcriptional regulator with XRE-family HTH domain
MSQSFGARLRYERERRQIALKSIAESTKIGLSLLEGLERDDVARWPSGIFRKSFIRSYAEAIGLEPDTIVREFIERYPDPLEVHTAPQEVITPQSASPLSIRLTIAWSGSVRDTIRRLVDCQIGRLRNLRIFQSANLPMVSSASPHGSEGAAPDPAQPV